MKQSLLFLLLVVASTSAHAVERAYTKAPGIKCSAINGSFVDVQNSNNKLQIQSIDSSESMIYVLNEILLFADDTTHSLQGKDGKTTNFTSHASCTANGFRFSLRDPKNPKDGSNADGEISVINTKGDIIFKIIAPDKTRNIEKVYLNVSGDLTGK